MTNRFRILSTTAAIGATMGLGAVFAPDAAAAPDDVTLTPVVSGNTVSAAIVNGSSKRVACELVGVPAGGSPTGQVAFGYRTPESLQGLVPAGRGKTVPLRVAEGNDLTGSTSIPAGSYDLYWGCTAVTINFPGDPTFGEQWGTKPPVTSAATAEPVRVEVPGNTAPGTPGAPGEPTDPADPPAPGAPEDICVSSMCAPMPELPELPELPGLPTIPEP